MSSVFVFTRIMCVRKRLITLPKLRRLILAFQKLYYNERLLQKKESLLQRASIVIFYEKFFAFKTNYLKSITITYFVCSNRRP